MKLYLDTCCLNRPFDDISQDRVFLESEAVLSILARCQGGQWNVANSEDVDLELSKTANPDKLKKVRALYAVAGGERLLITGEVVTRALYFQQNGLKHYDSLHLALAEFWRGDVLLTTDDGFLKAARRFETGLPAANPVAWLTEIMSNEN
jgi:predicted nucleic acid-binding protein